jgi:large subunit ribosomal protein L28
MLASPSGPEHDDERDFAGWRERSMAGVCELCGKTLSFGHNVSFSKHRTNRVFRPNIQKTHVMVNGHAKSINACTRCIRTMAKLPKK